MTYILWFLLSLPALSQLWQAASSSNDRILHMLVHPSGEWAAWLLIATLLATPLNMLFRGARIPRWLMRNRRYFGVASAGYAALHLAFYLGNTSLDRIMSDATSLDILAGWLAFLIFIPLAGTSCDWAMRQLGHAWKPLQRLAYAAGVLTLVHWAALHNWAHPTAALVTFAPLVALSAWRIWETRRRRNRRRGHPQAT